MQPRLPQAHASSVTQATNSSETPAIDVSAHEVPCSKSLSVTAPRAPSSARAQTSLGPIVLVAKPLARVLLLHTGGTLGMDSHASYEEDVDGHHVLVSGTGGKYHAQKSQSLKPGNMLNNLLGIVPELRQLANLDLKVVFNRDSCNIGPKEWVTLAKALDASRRNYDAFLVVHGTDTMAYTASAMSLMLAGFRKPIVFTGSQLPLAMPRSDARQNLIDSLTCATSSFNPPHVHLQEVALCFGGKLLRGNRARKVHSNVYEAFASPSYPNLARMGVDVEWNTGAMLQPEGVYRPRLRLDPAVLRVPIVPGVDPRVAYGDLVGRGVRGVVLESFGVGNMPSSAWLPWLRAQRKAGLLVSMVSQCAGGALQPELYASGSAALALGVEAGPQMTAETAAVKMMLCLQYPDLPLGVPLAGEM
ncbi:hypothetical protein ACKKBF_B20105 [Auxenochlorella protothecoides x Auxenochlorella symbiontica]